MSVDKCYNGTIFKTHNELSEIISFNEGAYLLLKRIITSNYSKNGKYPLPLINKAVQEWNLENILKLFASKQKGSKKFRTILSSEPKTLEMLNPGKKL